MSATLQQLKAQERDLDHQLWERAVYLVCRHERWDLDAKYQVLSGEWRHVCEQIDDMEKRLEEPDVK